MSQLAPMPHIANVDSSERYKSVYLHAGQIFANCEPTIVTTIVGSCVAVCMWDEQKGIGGVNHYLLAQAPTGNAPVGRFGNTAIAELVDRLIRLGARRRWLAAKVFGGAGVMPTLKTAGGGSLGTRNHEIAEELLSSLSIPVVSSDVGGSRGRKVIFHTDNGTAWVKHL